MHGGLAGRASKSTDVCFQERHCKLRHLEIGMTRPLHPCCWRQLELLRRSLSPMSPHPPQHPMLQLRSKWRTPSLTEDLKLPKDHSATLSSRLAGWWFACVDGARAEGLQRMQQLAFQVAAVDSAMVPAVHGCQLMLWGIPIAVLSTYTP